MHRETVFLIFAVAGLGHASTPAPFAGHCAALDRIVRSAARPELRLIGLDLLKRIVRAEPLDVAPSVETSLGLPPGQFGTKGFDALPVRVCALNRISQIDDPAAIDFLAGLTPADFYSDTTQQLWPATQIALHAASLRAIADAQDQIEFLKGVLSKHRDPISASAVLSWAVDKLCDSGATTALPEIEKAIRSRGNGQRDEDDLRFCRTQIDVLGRDPDRVKALSSVLQPNLHLQDMRLAVWAINQLRSMQSPAADAALANFAYGLAKLTADSPDEDPLIALRQRLLLELRPAGRN